MRVWVASEELWLLVLGGSHDDGLYVELPDHVAKRCQRAKDEYEACAQLLAEAHAEARKRGIKTRREKWIESRPKHQQTTPMVD